MNVYAWVGVALCVISLPTIVTSIGKPRRPLTPSTAAWMVLSAVGQGALFILAATR